jgi:hypothetical protein
MTVSSRSDLEGMRRVGRLEPLLSSHPATVVEDRDGWTLRTHNGALAVHHENTIVIQKGKPVVLTASNGLAFAV